MPIQATSRAMVHAEDDFAADEARALKFSNPITKVGIRRQFQFLCGLQGIRIYLLVFPLCVVLELVMCASMQAVGTEYPMHMSSYCAACGTDAEVKLFKIGPPAPGEPDMQFQGLFEVDEFFKSCLMDQLLKEFNDLSNSFKDAFLNSMVGHVLMIFAFQMERSTSMDWKRGGRKAANIWHIVGYLVLLGDCIMEYIYINSMVKKDPGFVKEGGYSACDDTEVVEVIEETNVLRDSGFTLALARSVSSGLVIICYHLSHDPGEMGWELEEDEEEASSSSKSSYSSSKRVSAGGGDPKKNDDIELSKKQAAALSLEDMP